MIEGMVAHREEKKKPEEELNKEKEGSAPAETAGLKN